MKLEKEETKMKTRIIYQAGYVAGENSWAVCGVGHSIESARAALKEVIHANALKSTVDLAIKMLPEKLPRHLLEKSYSEFAEYLQSSRYVENSFTDKGD